MATVCQTCGDKGFVEALVYCDSCKNGAVHRYCLGITPVPIEDYITWFCAHCDGSDSGSDCKEVDQTVKLRHILKKSGKKKKNKHNSNRQSSNHILLGLAVDDHGLQDTSNVESVEVSCSPIVEINEEPERRDSSDTGKSDELAGLVRNRAYGSKDRNGASFSEKSEKEMMKKKKKKQKRKKSTNHSLPVLAVEDHGLRYMVSSPTKETTTMSKRQESQEIGKPHELTSVVRNEVSVSEARYSSSVPDHNSFTNKKGRLSSGNIRVSAQNTQLAAGNRSCKDAESNLPVTNEGFTATYFTSPTLNNDRAQPIFKPIWRGSISVKQGKICSIDGLVAHLSSLACYQVHDKASSLRARLYAEMFPRLEIWPDSFLKKGPPTDKSIALYFFPSSESNDARVYYSLVYEMKKNDLAVRCMLYNVDLLLFTSYQLPMYCWTFNSKEYLWGIFRRRKTSRH